MVERPSHSTACAMRPVPHCGASSTLESCRQASSAEFTTITRRTSGLLSLAFSPAVAVAQMWVDSETDGEAMAQRLARVKVNMYVRVVGSVREYSGDLHIQVDDARAVPVSRR